MFLAAPNWNEAHTLPAVFQRERNRSKVVGNTIVHTGFFFLKLKIPKAGIARIIKIKQERLEWSRSVGEQMVSKNISNILQTVSTGQPCKPTFSKPEWSTITQISHFPFTPHSSSAFLALAFALLFFLRPVKPASKAFPAACGNHGIGS